MAKPTTKQLIRPVLEVLADGAVHSGAEVDALVEQRRGFAPGELRREGNQHLHFTKGRVLQYAGCVEKIGNDSYRITPRGEAALRLLEDQPDDFVPPDHPPFNQWLDEQGIDEVLPPEPVEPPPVQPGGEPSELDGLARKLYVDEGWLREVVELLEDKRQLILYGPPGTGKTYIARKLAPFLTGGDPARVEKVQFHPSYSYEDFVHGYRPKSGPGGTLSYALGEGPLLRISNLAQDLPGQTHILLIDEINRGNLPRIFGELLYLLEYRDEKLALMYGEEGAEHFSLPGNLWVLGTMNTADRSIGLIDAALRRRFHFVPLFPCEPPLDGLLDRWLSKEAPSMRHVATYVDRLNARLRERFGRHLQVGHSYFMVKDLDEARLERIWKADIMPFLEDQLFGHEDELETFSLEAIRRGPEGVALGAPDETGDADDQAE